MSKKPTVLILLFLCAGCLSQNDSSDKHSANIPEHISKLDSVTVYQRDAKPANDIQFERVNVFDWAETDTNEYIGSWENFAVDAKDRVYVYSRQKIHVFNPDGSYLRSMGNEGAGPGEFHSYASVQPRIGLNHLFAYDNIQQRINIYSLETLSPSHTVLMDPNHWNDIEELKETTSQPSTRFYIKNDGTLLVEFREPFPTGSGPGEFVDVTSGNPNTEVDKYLRYYLMDLNGQIISDKIFEQKNVNFQPGALSGFLKGVTPPLPSTRSSLIAVSDEGYIFSAWTEEFLIKVYDPDGEYLHSFYYPVEKSPLNPEKILNQSFPDAPQHIREDLEDADFPEIWPALNSMLLDDQNQLCVSTITDDQENYLWWVLDERGKLLARFKWTGEKLYRHSETNEIQAVKNGYLYTVEKDPELQIVKYRIKMD